MGALLLSSGCATWTQYTPKTEEIPLAVPQQWSAEAELAPGEVTGWLADFDSPTLESLVEEAIGRNFDLAAAAARVSAARARADIQGAELWPQIDATFDVSRSRSVSSGANDSLATTRNRFDVDGRVSWELDVWGRIRDTTRAALTDALAVEADFRAARLALAAEVARARFATIEAEQQLQLAVTVVRYFRQSLEVTDGRYRRGIADALDVRLARQNVASADSNLALRQRERDTAVRSFETLLGRYPAGDTDVPDVLPQIVKPVPAGLPSQLLERRPDLIAARGRLFASGDLLRAANKNRLPRFDLTVSGGATSEEFSDLLDYDAVFWSLIAGVLQPIFEGGRLQAERALAAADNREVWSLYAQIVLDALLEVESTLAAEAYLVAEEAALTRAAEEAREAAFLALDEYSKGLTDIVTLLESQRRAVNSESSRLRVARLRLDNRVNLYLALGGPFAPTPPASETAELDAR